MATKMPPILEEKRHEEPSAFRPEHLLREARRQRGIATAPVPAICVLDPDGDIVRHLVANGGAKRSPAWACYHTELFEFTAGGATLGVIGCAVGASFAVLVAEELFASGCELLLSITSSGRLARVEGAKEPPYFVLIEAALRDEGTSYHYLPPSELAHAAPAMVELGARAAARAKIDVVRGSTWTTDAPFRETEHAIAVHTARGFFAVEMEAAALYAFAEARGKRVLCFAHVTNEMARSEGDFEKGAHSGALEALTLVSAVAEESKFR